VLCAVAQVALLQAELRAPVEVVWEPATSTVARGGARAPRSDAGLDAELAPVLAPLPPVAGLSETVERPLFTETRRPEPAPDQPTTVASAGGGGLPPTGLLSGVIIVDGEPVALLLEARETAAKRLRVGDRVEGWEVAEIAAEQVVLTQGTQRHVLELRRFEPIPAGLAGPARAARGETREAERDDDGGAAPRRPRRPRVAPRRSARERARSEAQPRVGQRR
jgi:hypothetical protein